MSDGYAIHALCLAPHRGCFRPGARAILSSTEYIVTYCNTTVFFCAFINQGPHASVVWLAPIQEPEFVMSCGVKEADVVIYV